MIQTTTRALAAAAALLAATAAHAQSIQTYRPVKSLYMLNWEASWAVGSFADDYIDEWSYRGLSFESRSMVREGLSAGIGFTYNRYEQTYSNIVQANPGGGTVSGPVYRFADQFAIKALVHKYFGRGSLLPYLGVGIGGVWTYAYQQVADIAAADDGFDFIVSPEIGLAFKAASGASSVGLNAALRYNYTTADFAEVDDAQSLTAVLGLYFSY
jgi:hypothetical protein